MVQKDKEGWNILTLICADYIHLKGENMNSRKKWIQDFLDSSKEVCLEANAARTKYMCRSCHQSSGQNYYKSMVHEYFENTGKF
jgi:hypothetical protein